MKYFILFILTLSSSLSWSADLFPESMASHSCQDQAKAFLEKFFLAKAPHWVFSPSENPEIKQYRASYDVGLWFELSVPNQTSEPLMLTDVSDHVGYQFTWDKSCTLKADPVGPLRMTSTEDQKRWDLFTDQSLRDLLKNKKSGVIYLWSPRFVYSVTEFRRFRDIAKKMKLEFIPIVDHRVSFEEAQSATKKVGVALKGRKLASVELYMQNGTLHYPTLFVFANGRMNPHRIVGVLTPKDIENTLSADLKELKQ